MEDSLKSTRYSSEVVSGVYCIENINNNKKYIGSSVDIYGRWVVHIRDLNKKNHCNPHLQNAWDKCGRSGFNFYIVEILSTKVRSTLFKAEQKWMDFYQSANSDYGYNINKKANCPASPPASVEMIKSGKYKITLLQFNTIIDLLLHTDKSIIEISKIVKINHRTVYQIYYKKNYKELTKDLSFPRRTCRTNCILSEDDVLKIVGLLKENKYNSEICKMFNVGEATIADIRNHKTWVYLTKDIVFDSIKNRKSLKIFKKPVLQYTLDGDFIKEYASARDAEKETGIGYKLISRVCNGERTATCGYIFKFKQQ